MKHKSYFNAENIRSVARQIFDSLSKKQRMAAIPFQPESAALLVIDMQKYFLSPDSHAYIPSARAIIKNVKSLIQIFSKKGLPVVLTRHINDNTDAGMMLQWWGELITGDDPMANIIDDLKYPMVKIIKKSQYDAFFRTGLEEFFKEMRVNQLVITGVMTHLCCDTTARSAFMRGFAVFFTVDGTATQSYQFHMASLVTLCHGFVVPVLCQEIYEKVKRL